MTTRVAVVGAGFWATAMHLPALAAMPDVEVVAIVAASEQSARRVADQYGIPRATADLADALEGVDLIDVVAPPDVHAPAVLAAAAAGVDAICIKPLGRTVAEAKSMIAATKAAGTRLFYAENVPFIPALQEAKRLIEAGHIGDVVRVRAIEGIGEPHADWFFDPVRSGGGAVLDMAVHSIAFCRFFAGAEVSTVSAETQQAVWGHRTTAEDSAVLTLRFDNDVIGVCEDSWALAGAMDSRFEIIGTAGRIDIDNLQRQPIKTVSTRGSELLPAGWGFPLPIPGALADGHVDMLRHFIDAHRTGTPSPSEGEVGLACLDVVEAALIAARTGMRTPLRSTLLEKTP